MARALLWSVSKMIEIGHGIGNYRVTAKLGEGGMGVVFLAEHPVIGRKAALKAIHPQFARNTEVVSRFVNEAKAVNQIRHEHIVDVTDFGHTPAGDFYFIMELLQGATLAECLQKEGRLSPQRALRIGAQIAGALQASHDHGVIHRDLKPDNIFLTTHGDEGDFVKVLDFGLAKLVTPDDMSPRNTKSGSLMGTPLYMSPEQCEGTTEIDHRADIYSLGVILFEMLTGKVPFAGTGYGQVILQHMTARPPAARSIVPDLPLALEAILTRALAKDRELRFQSMAELRDALLDPARYAASIPGPRGDDADSGSIRVAPFAATDLGLRATVPGAVPDTSTLDDGAGQLGAPVFIEDEIPRTRSGRGLMLAVLAAAAVIVFPSQRGAGVPGGDLIRQQGMVSKSGALVPEGASPALGSLAPEGLPDDPPLEVRPAPATMSVAAADSRRELRGGRAHRHRPRPAFDFVDEDQTLEPTIE
jgi:hypothetical protein